MKFKNWGVLYFFGICCFYGGNGFFARYEREKEKRIILENWELFCSALQSEERKFLIWKIWSECWERTSMCNVYVFHS